jgi:hypothetical protein
MKKIMVWTSSYLFALVFFIGTPSCEEQPRARPGFQDPPTFEPVNKPVLAPLLPDKEKERLAYEQAFQGRLSYYAQVRDQFGNPVPDAHVLVTVERNGMKGVKFLNCRTTTDAEGKFSVVGGIGTDARCFILKKGYSPEGKRGTLRGEPRDKLFATKDRPDFLIAWKNTGYPRNKIIQHDSLDIGQKVSSLIIFNPPIPPRVFIDMVKGKYVTKDDSWDICLEWDVDEKGQLPTADEINKLPPEERYHWYYHIRINEGTMAYYADPKSGYPIRGDGYTFDLIPGVVEGALKAERLPYLYRADTRVFQFRSRGGKVHGVCDVNGGVGGSLDGSINISVRGAVNASGSPALFEKEPTDEEIAIMLKHYPLSE